jgi:phosphoglycerate dehydrogenase-like enzyme
MIKGMSKRRLRIWVNQGLPDDARQMLERGAAGHELVFARQSNRSNLAYGETDPIVRDSDIAFGQPDLEDILVSDRLKWVHLSTAGYTRYDREDLRAALRSRGGVMTNSSAVFADPCAQHVLAMMLGLARQLPAAMAEQQQRRWTYSPLREQAHVLTGQSALIAGLGAIGYRLIDLLRPFRMTLAAIRRNPRGDEPVSVRPMHEIDQLLTTADHVINLLPSGENTRGFFNADRFGKARRGARFYNVGRGDTVDQQALINALQSGQIGFAYLDVTSPEPLPANDPLWDAPNCFITPHIAGGRQDEYGVMVSHFIENLARLEGGEDLKDRIF